MLIYESIYLTGLSEIAFLVTFKASKRQSAFIEHQFLAYI